MTIWPSKLRRYLMLSESRKTNTTACIFARLVFMFHIVVSPAFAVKVNNLYVADVSVASQDQQQLEAGAKEGLLQVLVRVSGDARLAQNALIRNARAADYYYQYSYQAIERESQTDAVVSEKILRLHFQPDAIASLLRAANLRIWGTNRPAVLVWLVSWDETERRLTTDAESEDLIALLDIQARRRGIRLLYPLLDIEGLRQISADDVSGSFKTRIDAASERYNPDAILTARWYKLSSGRWAANWSYRIEDRWHNSNHTARSTDAAVATVMIDDLTDALAEKYAFAASRTEIELVVENISSVKDYASVTQYLDGLAPVLESQVVEIYATKVRFRLITQGSPQQLDRLIRLDEKMILLPSIRRMNKPNYRWMDGYGNPEPL